MSFPNIEGRCAATMTNGLVVFTLSPALAVGRYHIRADVTDLAGNTGSSTVQPFTVISNTISTVTGQNGLDPIHGDAKLEICEIWGQFTLLVGTAGVVAKMVPNTLISDLKYGSLSASRL